MPPKHRLAVAAVLALSLTGCAPSLPKFRAGAPVEVEKKRLRGRVYKQDGQAVDLPSLLSALEGTDASSADARGARRWATGASVMGALGAAAALGYIAVDGEDAEWAAGAGVGALLVSLVAQRVASDRLERAVRSYNGALASPTALVVPWAGTIRGSQDRCVAAGVAVRF